MGVWILTFVLWPVVFVGIWAAVCGITSALGGWSALGREYAAGDAAFSGEVHSSQSAMFGIMGYGWTVNVGSGPEGLQLDVMPLFRIGHKKLLIPWEDVSVTHDDLGVPVAVFRFADAERVRMRTFAGLARNIAAGSGGALDLPEELAER